MKNFSSIQVALERLIEEKSKRDKMTFTGAQLAAALCMPRSMITRLIHPNPLKRVINPRIDTLLKIVEFFKADGFNITVDDLLGSERKVIDVQQQSIAQDAFCTIPLYTFDANLDAPIGKIEVKVATPSKHLLAFTADEDIKPMFKKGSVFIVDQALDPEDDTLVAIKFTHSNKIQIKKYHSIHHKRTLLSFDPSEPPIVLLPTMHYQLMGVIIQINART